MFDKKLMLISIETEVNCALIKIVYLLLPFRPPWEACPNVCC